MKLRVIATFLAILGLTAGMASAQTIGIYADPVGGSCNISALAPATAFILAINGGPVAGITGAEFQVVGKDPTWFAISTPNPASNLQVGDPFAGGANIAFPTCQNTPIVSLYTVTLIPVAPVTDGLLSIREHTSPSNPNFICSLVTLCDAPAFTKVCVPGGEARVNSDQFPCTVAVEEATWSKVKGMYN